MKKNTLLRGVLTGSFGIFVSKFLGLLYIIPLNYLAGENNISFYSIAYTYYGMLLNICSAGIPFALASMVAKYAAKNDYQTIKLVRKIATSIILALSFLVLVFFIILVPLNSKYLLGANSNAQDIKYLQISFLLLSSAIILVPFLSTIRGYYQGLKEMGIYAFSQTIEQLVRVLMIVILGFIFVKILNFPNIFSIYSAIFAATLGAFASIIYIYYKTNKINKEIELKTVNSSKTTILTKDVIKELFEIGLPFIGVSFLTMIGPIINSNFFIRYATSVGVDYTTAKLVLGIYQVNVSKITAIPTVLTIGYSAGLVPYLTEVYEQGNSNLLKQYIYDILNSINYIIVPLALMFLLLSKPIYYLFYGSTNILLGSEILFYSSILIYIDTLSPIITSIMITLKMRKNTIILMIISGIVKFISFFILIKYFGYNGIIYSSFLSIFTTFILGLYLLKIKFNLEYTKIVVNFLKVLFSSITINAIFVLLKFIGFDFNYTNRFTIFLQLAVYGILGILIYIFCGEILNINQDIFKKSFKELIIEIKNK